METQNLIDLFISENIPGQSNIHCCFDAVHTAEPTNKDVIKAYLRKHPGTARKELIRTIRSIENRFHKLRKIYPHTKKKTLLRRIGKKSNKMTCQLAYYKNLYEDGTRDIVHTASEKSGASYFIPKRSRLCVDINRRPNTRTTISKLSSEHYSLRAQQAVNNVIANFMHNCHCIDHTFHVILPFLHISVYESLAQKAKISDIIIGNGMKAKHLPCDASIARWIEHKFVAEITKYKIKKKSGKLFTTVVAIEGEPLCGSFVNVERRFGGHGQHGFGRNYQHIQIEIVREMRFRYPNRISKILSKIAKDFSVEFPTAYHLKEYIRTHQTIADIHREKGKLYILESEKSKHIGPGKMYLNYLLRRALHAKIGNIVIANSNNYVLARRPSSYRKHRLPLFAKKEKLRLPIIISKP